MTASASSRHCNRCGTRLASDNSEAACQPCQRAAQETSQSPPDVPASFWQADQMRDALEARHMGHVVRAYRNHPFHGRKRIPQEIMARWLCVSQAQLSRIEAGRPLRDLERLIQWATLLRMPREMLWFDLREIAAEGRIGPVLRPDTTIVQPRPDSLIRGPGVGDIMPYLDELNLLREESPDPAMARERTYDQLVKILSRWASTMKRRELLQVLGWAASAAAMKRPHNEFDTEEHPRIAHALEAPRRVDAAVIENIENVLWRLIRQDDALGAQITLDTVMAQRNIVQLILPECPSGLRVRLLSLFSNYSLQAGWLLYDLTDFDSANYYYEHARVTAHEAENTELGALVLCTMSHLGTWRGQPRVGIDHAMAAQGWAAQANEPRLRAYAADVAARAFALDGQRTACMRALDTAEANLNGHYGNLHQSRMYFYTRGQLTGTQSHCLLQFGDVRGAIRAGEESLTLVDPSLVRNLAFTKLFLGDAYAAAKEIEKATSVIGEAAALVTQNRSTRLVQRLRSTRKKLNPWQRSSAVRRLDEQIQSYRLS